MQPIRITKEIRDSIAELAGYGLTWAQIGSAVKINHRTLQRHCQDDYDRGKQIAIGTIAGTLFRKAAGGSVPAIIFFLKTQGGWKETNKHELSGPDGEPIKTEQTGTVSLSPDQMQAQVKAIVAALEKEY